MSYMLLIVEPTGQRAERSPQEGREVYDRMLAFSASLRERGLLEGVQSLASHASATRVSRDAGGQARVVDGPFAEAKEMIGGFFLVNCATRDEAVALARECPAAEWATVEVRGFGPCYDDSVAPPPAG